VAGFVPSDNIYRQYFALGYVALIASDLRPKGFTQLASVAIDQSKN
jgi:hypothetical protein